MAFTQHIEALKWTGRALRYRNYRLFFMGQGVSLIGTWMQRLALQWFVYSLTGSAWMLGSLEFSSQIPALLIAPWAGLVADRANRHRLVVFTQAAAMVQALTLATLVLTGRIEVWHLFALAILLGCINGFDMPLRQSFVPETVDDRADLGNAIALNSSIFNGARLVGPTLAGFILHASSAGFCFLLNGLSYIAVIWALLLMRLQPREIARDGLSGLASLRDGFRYAWHFRLIRYLLLNIAVVTFAGSPYMTLLPVFAKRILHGGPQTLGALYAMVAVGAIGGAFFLASRKDTKGLRLIISAGTVVYSVGLILFAYSHWLPVSMAVLTLVGVGMMALMASTNTLLQTLVDDGKRGRVMSLYMMSFMGAGPIGSLAGGFAATHFGAPATVWTGGLLAMAAAGFFVTRLRGIEVVAGKER